MSQKAVLAFADAINRHDLKAIASLMTDDHVFIDAQGNEGTGKDAMKEGWQAYFRWFPDYEIEIVTMAGEGDTVLATGYAGGTYKGVETPGNDNKWRIPAAWKIVVKKEKVQLWQVYADTKIPFDIIGRSADDNEDTAADNAPRATGIGGIFFKCKDPATLKQWYEKHLGLKTDEYGTNFEWRQTDGRPGFTQWSPFGEKTKYFAPSEKQFMINYRVTGMEALVAQLKKDGVVVTKEIETYEYGKFVHIMDPEGNKIELWEPDDSYYDKIVKGRTK